MYFDFKTSNKDFVSGMGEHFFLVGILSYATTTDFQLHMKKGFVVVDRWWNFNLVLD